MKTSDRVRITCDGRTVDGTIIFGSANEVSLMLGFEAMLTGHVGMMPVLKGDDGIYRSIVDNVAVKIELSGD